MTILGDKAQTMEDETQDVLKFLPKIFGKDIRKIVMNRSYRNTMEVAQYANHLTGIEDMELFERHGEPVDERTFLSTEEALETVLEKWLNRREEFETEALIFLRKDQNDQQYHNRYSKNNRNCNRQKFQPLFLFLCRIRKPFQKAFIHPVAHRCKDIGDQCAVQERFQNVEYNPDTCRNICTLTQDICCCKSKCQNGSACDTKFHVFCVFIMFQ